jgi:UDP-N-acetylglucosamine/UDP-N-acetylgalactosamine diphosphorylase
MHADDAAALATRGVRLILPETIEIDADVAPDRIGDGVVIHPGCRVRGAATVIGPGCVLGAEAPVTLDGCALGASVTMAGGYATRSVFLDGVGVGSGAQIREACLLEEQSGVAHCVGLKQTILFPYAQLGSVINFCDALLAGGSSRHDHSEVGSGFVHFNFTPRGDKATASRFGDVPRGVFLREPRVFLGGQGGAAGPVTTGFGAFTAAGVILREDLGDFARLTALGAVRPAEDADPDAGLVRVVQLGLGYVGQLAALRAWYDQVRRPYLTARPLGAPLLDAALAVIDAARAERAKRLVELAGLVDTHGRAARAEFADRAGDAAAAMLACRPRADADFVAAATADATAGVGYLDAVAALPDEVVARGRTWLSGIVADVFRAGAARVPGLARPDVGITVTRGPAA